MPRGRSVLSTRSEISEMDNDGVEAEMAKLLRRFRIMEGDSQAYTIQSQDQIRRQQQEIQKLKSEQEELLQNLHVSENVSRKQKDVDDTNRLRSLLGKRDELDKELEREKKCHTELQKEISAIEKLEEERRGAVVCSNDTQRAQKAIRTLENKLYRALIYFSVQLTKNSHLREELETLRMERVRFQQLHSQLTKELKHIRKDIGEMIQMSTTAYDARVEAQSKMTMMKDKALKDLVQYNADMKELERIIDHEHLLKEFMMVKTFERSQDEEMERKHLAELREHRRVDLGEESLETLQEVFQKVQEATEEENLDLMVTKFIQVEDRNFALFNFVNELNNEAEQLRDQIHQVKDEMENFQIETLKREQQHHALLRKIDDQQRETETQAREYEEQSNAASKILNQIKTRVQSLFSKTDCCQSGIEDRLGSSIGLSNNNIICYLGLVEQKTNEMLTMQAFLQSQDTEKDYNPKELAKFLLGQNPDMLSRSVSIQPPITGDSHGTEESPLTDEEDRPLSQEELRQRIMKGVLQKEGPMETKAHRITKSSNPCFPGGPHHVKPGPQIHRFSTETLN